VDVKKAFDSLDRWGTIVAMKMLAHQSDKQLALDWESKNKDAVQDRSNQPRRPARSKKRRKIK